MEEIHRYAEVSPRAGIAKGALVLAVSLLSSVVFGFRPTAAPPQQGLDPSYVFAANHASVQGLRWGTEFVSTLGPYGYLIQSVDLEATRFKRLVSEWILVALVGVACASYVLIGPALGTPVGVVFSLLFPYALHVQANEQRCFLLVLTLLLVSLHAPPRIARFSFVAASVLAGFFLFVKLSLGVGGLLTLFAGTLLSRRAKLVVERVGLLGLGAASGFAVGWLAHQGTLRGVSGFIATAIPILSGYSSAMSLAPPAWEATAIYFVYFALVLAVWGAASRSASVLVTVAACGTPLFVAWKHAMVRQDAGHVRAFILIGLYVVCVLLRQALAKNGRAGSLLLAVAVPGLLAPWFFPSASRADLSLTFLLRSLTARAHFDGAPHGEPNLDGVATLRLGEDARRIVGEGPIDVYPGKVSTSRPTISSGGIVPRRPPSAATHPSSTG